MVRRLEDERHVPTTIKEDIERQRRKVDSLGKDLYGFLMRMIPEGVGEINGVKYKKSIDRTESKSAVEASIEFNAFEGEIFATDSPGLYSLVSQDAPIWKQKTEESGTEQEGGEKPKTTFSKSPSRFTVEGISMKVDVDKTLAEDSYLFDYRIVCTFMVKEARNRLDFEFDSQTGKLILKQTPLWDGVSDIHEELDRINPAKDGVATDIVLDIMKYAAFVFAGALDERIPRPRPVSKEAS